MKAAIFGVAPDDKLLLLLLFITFFSFLDIVGSFQIRSSTADLISTSSSSSSICCSIRNGFAKSSSWLGLSSNNNNNNSNKEDNNNNNDAAAAAAAKTSTSSPVEEYRNVVTKFLSNFMSNDGESNMEEQDALAIIDFNAPKLSKKISLETFAGMIYFLCFLFAFCCPFFFPPETVYALVL